MAFGFHSFCWNVSSLYFCSFKGNMSFFSWCFKDFMLIIVFQNFDYNKPNIFICFYLVWSLWVLWFCEIRPFITFGKILTIIYTKIVSCPFLLFSLFIAQLHIFWHMIMFYLSCVLLFPFFVFFFFHNSFQVFCIDLSLSLLLYVVCCRII